MRELLDTPHNKRCRESMKKLYHEKNGKLKSSLKYYKRKYRDDETVHNILHNDEITDIERLKELKIYNLTKNLQDKYQ
tara:strand:+ start:564 stop:797 length:234 start_codon:yes stop_codon:yes gene_type:complete